MVIETLDRRKVAKGLWNPGARLWAVQDEVEALGVGVYFEYVPRTNPYHRRANEPY
jgi:hypothetical protein